MQIEEDEPLETIKYSKFEPYMLRGNFLLIQFSRNRNSNLMTLRPCWLLSGF